MQTSSSARLSKEQRGCAVFGSQCLNGAGLGGLSGKYVYIYRRIDISAYSIHYKLPHISMTLGYPCEFQGAVIGSAYGNLSHPASGAREEQTCYGLAILKGNTHSTENV